jgi:hypothetical protein
MPRRLISWAGMVFMAQPLSVLDSALRMIPEEPLSTKFVAAPCPRIGRAADAIRWRRRDIR